MSEPWNEQNVRFGRYDLCERLGKGGMAELYRAVLVGPEGFRKTVAIKKILPELSRDPGFQKMFLQEGRIMADLSHRNLVEVFELGSVEGELYISLELIQGCDLGRVLRHKRRLGQPLDPNLAIFIAKEILQGLEYMHSFRDERGQILGIVHRDVNPQNVLLSLHGDVKLGDFGIAKVAGLDERRQKQIKGKLEYLSPEQARGDEARPTSDLYAVGLLLYEMLSGERFIQGEGAEQLVSRAARPVWRPLRAADRNVSAELENVVKRAMREAPEGRFGSAAAFATALHHILDQSSWRPTADDVARLVAETQSAFEDPEASISTTSNESKSPTDRPLDAEGPALTRPRTVAIHTPVDTSLTRRRTFWWSVLAGSVPLVLVVVAVGLWSSDPPNARRHAPPGTPAPLPSFGRTEVLEPVEVSADETPLQAVCREVCAAQRGCVAQCVTPVQAATVQAAKGPAASPALPTMTLATLGLQKQKTPPLPQPVPASPPQTDISTLTEELSHQSERVRRLGIRAGDSPAIDRLLRQASNLLANGNALAAQQAVLDLDHALDAFTIDRGFVERKMQRLQRALSQAGRQAEFSSSTEQILTNVLNNRFQEANRAINQVFDRL